MAGRQRRDQFAEFVNSVFTDEIGGPEEIEDLQEILEGLMLPGDAKQMEQAPSNRDFPDDIAEGWSSEEGEVVNMPFEGNARLLVDDNFPENPTPLDFFSLFIDEGIIDLIVEQTNLYAQRKIDAGNLKEHSRLHRWKPVTRAEMRVFLALCIATGLCIKPSLPEYWNADEVTETPFFAKHMTSLRFEAILSNFHLVDNRADDLTDPLFKVRPFYNHLRAKFLVYSPDRDISFDEATCPWKGRLRIKVYNPNKPHKFGIKLYEACEAKSGYVIGMDIYQGSTPSTDYSEALDIQEDLTVTTRTVLSLLSITGLLDKGHHIYMDNYYTSPELFRQLYLMNTYACGTVRTNRLGLPQVFKKPARRADRIQLLQGQSIYRQNEELLAVKYHDKRDVHMLSTIHSPTEVKLDKRDEAGNQIWKPTCVVDYIRNMGGVDTADQIIGNYSLLRKTVKWWRKLFFYLFTVAICNGYCLHKKFATGTQLPHYEFRRQIVRQLVLQSPDAPKPVACRSREEISEPSSALDWYTQACLPHSERGSKEAAPNA